MKGRLVGMMRNRQDLDSEIVFDFDDGTGRIKARIWYSLELFNYVSKESIFLGLIS